MWVMSTVRDGTGLFGAEGYWLTGETMRWFWDSYVPAPERHEFTVSPLQASLEQLRGLPPALIVTNENDVVRDDGEAYGRQLTAAGVAVRASRYLGAIHDLVLLNPIVRTPPARAALTQVNETLRTVFAPSFVEKRTMEIIISAMGSRSRRVVPLSFVSTEER
jgi:acetyl esterase